MNKIPVYERNESGELEFVGFDDADEHDFDGCQCAFCTGEEE